MNCPLRSEETTGILLDYSAGLLDRSRKEALERHMQLCGNCSALVAEQTEVWALMDAWEAPPVSMSFSRKVMQAVGEAAAVPWYGRFFAELRTSAWKPAIPLAAGIVVIAAGFMFDHQKGTGQSHAGIKDGSRVSITEVDQVERTLDDIQLLRQFDAASSSRPL